MIVVLDIGVRIASFGIRLIEEFEPLHFGLFVEESNLSVVTFELYFMNL